MKEFISDHDNNKVRVLDFLINKNTSVNMLEICSATQLSYKTVRSIIDSFEENTNIEAENLEIYYNKAGKIESVKLINSSLVDVSFFYLEKSILFIMIKELFLKGRLDNKSICENYYISTTTCTRYRKKLKELFKSFELELTSSGELKGDEYRIRNFFFLSFSNATSKWIFSKESYNFLEHSLNVEFPSMLQMDYSQKEHMRLLLYISITRNSQGYILTQKGEVELRISGKLLKIYSNIADYIVDYFPYFEDKDSEIEYVFVSVLRTQVVRLDEISEESVLIVESKEIVNFDEICHFFTNTIIKTFFNNDKEYFNSIHSSVILFLSYATVNFYDASRFYYFNNEEIQLVGNVYENQVLERVRRVVKEFEDEYKEFIYILKVQHGVKREAFITQVYLLVYSLLSRFEPIKHKEKVKIYVQSSKVYVADIIRRKIEKIFAENVQILDDFSFDIDVLVTDKEYQMPNLSAKKVIVPIFSDHYALHRLIEVIDEEIVSKIDSIPFE